MLAWIAEACEAADQGEGWRVERDGSRSHVRVRNERAVLAEQGWKLHVSADVISAKEVLHRSLPTLLAEGVAFKVVSSIPRLGALNDGRAGLDQVGKFITVYPQHDAQAVRLAVALDEATRGLSGPLVPSDRPLRPGSLIHYRYGSFATRFVQLPSGEIAPAISDPDGRLIPDRRGPASGPPSWALDPFVAAGIAADPVSPKRIIGGRYLIVGTPYRSPAGAVHFALDTEASRRLVLKRRRRDTSHYLQNEAKILARLASDERFPKAYGLVEEDGDHFLAMEEVEGETLGWRLRSLGRQGRHVPVRQAITWGRELAAMLGTVHSEGLVYRDLKPDNVMIAPNGRLRLIDFELACAAGSKNPLGGVGTRGYASPQRALGDPPAASDDVYSLGALLYFLLTHAAPELAPHPHALLDRPVDLLNPAVGPEFAKVISRCLSSEPRARYPSMSALDAALAEVRAEASRMPASFGTEPTVESGEDARRHRELARRLGDAICAAARPAADGRGVMWLSAGPGGTALPLRDLCAGTAGTVLALADMVEEFGDPEHRETLEEGARWLTASRPISEPPLPGLYVGEAGVGAALLRAGQALGVGQLVAEAAERGRRISALPHVSPDLFNGAAGRLRFHLLLYQGTADTEHLHHAAHAGEFLLESAEDTDGGGLRWTIPPGYGRMSGRAYLGYAHGSAGIGDALLELFEATQDERFLAAAWRAGRWLAGQAIPVLDDNSGLDWPPVEGAPPAGAAWCHGATGVGRFFLHAAASGALPEAMDLAAPAARAAARGARSSGPTQCHGLAGNIEFLIDIYRETGETAYLAEASSLARLLEAFATEREGSLVFPSDAPESFVPDYMTGYAGVACCFLRLGDPRRVQDGMRP